MGALNMAICKPADADLSVHARALIRFLQNWNEQASTYSHFMARAQAAASGAAAPGTRPQEKKAKFPYIRKSVLNTGCYS
jgi:hypothetical protein